MPLVLHDTATRTNMTTSNCSYQFAGAHLRKQSFLFCNLPRGCPVWMCARDFLPSARGDWILWRPGLHFEPRGGTSYAKWRYSSQPVRWCSDPCPSYILPLSVAIEKLRSYSSSTIQAIMHRNDIYCLSDIFSAVTWLASSRIVPVWKSCPPESSRTVCEWILSKDLCIKRILCSASYW